MNKNEILISILCAANLIIIFYFVALLVIPPLKSRIPRKQGRGRLTPSPHTPSSRVIELTNIIPRKRAKTKVINLGSENESKNT